MVIFLCDRLPLQRLERESLDKMERQQKTLLRLPIRLALSALSIVTILVVVSSVWYFATLYTAGASQVG